MTRSRYSPEQRQNAMELAKRVGPVSASDRTGIPVASIRSMLDRSARLDKARAVMIPVQDVQLPAASDFPVVPWDTLRESMPDQLGHLGQLAMAAAEAAVQLGNGTEADKLASVAVKCIDRAETLRGRGQGAQVPISVVLTASLEALRGFQQPISTDSTVSRPLLDDPALVKETVDGLDDLPLSEPRRLDE